MGTSEAGVIEVAKRALNLGTFSVEVSALERGMSDCCWQFVKECENKRRPKLESVVLKPVMK